MGLNLPSAQTLANAAGAKFGLSDLGPYEAINCLGAPCWNNTISRSATADSDAAITLNGSFWTSTYDSGSAYFRYYGDSRTRGSRGFWANRSGSNYWRPGTLCVAD